MNEKYNRHIAGLIARIGVGLFVVGCAVIHPALALIASGCLVIAMAVDIAKKHGGGL
jgi:L-cystine uptake protein TcyP (sodium:dicarboxylate symporter family)